MHLDLFMLLQNSVKKIPHISIVLALEPDFLGSKLSFDF